MTFAGFSTDSLLRLPTEFFTDVLPAISLASEVKVTLHVFYRLSQRRDHPRRLCWEDLRDDTLLHRSLQAISKIRPVADLLEEGLDAALQRHTLLHLPLSSGGHITNWYLVHTASNRAWVEDVHKGHITVGQVAPPVEERSTLFHLYEQHIGLITPFILEELRDFEQTYPHAWVEDAIREAVRANARSLRYVRKVLESWASHGRKDASSDHARQRPIDIEECVSGAFGELFRLGSDTADL